MGICIKTGWPVATVLFLLAAAMPVIGVAQDEPEPTKFGREARVGTPILDRDPDQPLTDREKIIHLLNRTTFAATPELIEEVERAGIDDWAEQQLQGNIEESAELLDRLAKLESLSLSLQEIVARYNRQDENRNLRNVPRAELKDAVLLLSVYGKNQFREVMCDFWRNHFNVDSSKGNARYYALSYERDVIRAEVLNSFERMLYKQARHPAMLFYLDNYISRATPAKELQKIGRQAMIETRDYGAALEAVDIARMRGINENFARELMELHTLGVDNYYTQEDIIIVANALTGWTIQQNPEQPIEFRFRSNMHSSENRLFLKTPIPAQPENAEMEGQAILNILAQHKGTARFITYKLCRHLVNDSPSRHMVRRVSAVFLRRNTNLPRIYSAIIDDREFYDPANYQAKFKRPFEFVVGALRVTHAEIDSTAQIHRALVSMSEPVYQCEDPTGYYDQADAWRDPGVMVNRWQFALRLGTGQIKGVKIPDAYWDDFESGNPQQWKELLISRVLPGGCSQKTSDALDSMIRRKYSKSNNQPEQMGGYLLGLLIGSPEFQRQ